MLTRNPSPIGAQTGAVLFFAIVVLVGTTLAGLALTRSVDTGNLIAGNLAFQQASTQSGDAGVEAAVEWLEANLGQVILNNNSYANGFAANGLFSTQVPAAGQGWDELWRTTWTSNAQIANVRYDCATHVPSAAGACTEDTAGNRVSYAIQRMCTALGSPNSISGAAWNTCFRPPSISCTSCSKSGGAKLNYNPQMYFRVTVRVDGPRNTVNYLQALVAL